MYTNDEIKLMLQELEAKMEKHLICPELKRDWIPKDEVMKFWGFKNTQMSKHEKMYGIVMTKIGEHKFYSTKSVAKIMENNIIS